MKNFVLLCGISIFGIVGGYYYYLKIRERDKDDESQPGSKRSLTTLEFVMSNEKVPLVIGRNGIIVKNIEEKTNTTINFREKDENSHICKIEGTISDIKIAKQLVDAEASRPPIITDEILVPADKVSVLSGEAVSEIINKTANVKIWIDSQSKKPLLKDFRRVLITGTKDRVNAAKKLIEKKLEEEVVEQPKVDEPPRREPRQPSPSLNTSTSSIHTTESPRDILPTPEKLRANSQDGQLEIYVSAICSPSKFYVQIVGPMSGDLDILVDNMTEYYNNPENQKLHRLRNPYLGQIVAAKFNVDNRWYRAEVNAIQPNEFSTNNEIVIDLYFVDYGDTQFAKCDDIFELRTDFLSLRFQAIEVFLANIQPLNTTTKLDAWNEKSIEKFEELTHVAQWVKLNAKVVTYKERPNVTVPARFQRESSPVPGVEIYDYVNGSDINVAEELVNNGLAEYAQFGDLQRSSVLKIGEEPKSEEEIVVKQEEKKSDDKDNEMVVNGNSSKNIDTSVQAETETPEKKSHETIRVEIEPATPESSEESVQTPDFSEETSKISRDLPTIKESSPEIDNPTKAEEKVPEIEPLKPSKEESASNKPQNGTHSSPEKPTEMPGTSVNGSHQKPVKNKSDKINDFISGERAAGTGDVQSKNKKSNKKKALKGQDWNEMLNE